MEQEEADGSEVAVLMERIFAIERKKDKTAAVLLLVESKEGSITRFTGGERNRARVERHLINDMISNAYSDNRCSMDKAIEYVVGIARREGKKLAKEYRQ